MLVQGRKCSFRVVNLKRLGQLDVELHLGFLRLVVLGQAADQGERSTANTRKIIVKQRSKRMIRDMIDGYACMSVCWILDLESGEDLQPGNIGDIDLVLLDFLLVAVDRVLIPSVMCRGMRWRSLCRRVAVCRRRRGHGLLRLVFGGHDVCLSACEDEGILAWWRSREQREMSVDMTLRQGEIAALYRSRRRRG